MSKGDTPQRPYSYSDILSATSLTQPAKSISERTSYLWTHLLQFVAYRPMANRWPAEASLSKQLGKTDL